MSITPSQTVGPYFHLGLIGERWTRIGDEPGPRIAIAGSVLDAAGQGVTDAMLEVWQPERKAFARFATDPSTGAFRLEVYPPASLAAPHAPHLCLGVFARGLLKRLYTRIYMEADPANAADPVLALVPAQRQVTLMARPDGANPWRFDVRLSGPGETVFFEC